MMLLGGALFLSLDSQESRERANAPAPILSQTSSELISNTPAPDEYGNTTCRGWCGKTLLSSGKPNCVPRGIDRIRLAFQDENCDTAMQSANSAGLVSQKIAKVLESGLFVFFRGTVTLFDYDIVCNHQVYI
jgi:hypothetical protein